jgi:membrane protein YdbS with pleckstrin-like domain
MTFQQEFVVARIRQRSSVLLLAHLALFVSVFVLAFMSGKVFDQWINITVYSALGLLLVIVWLLPSWRYAATFVDVTTTRIVLHGGLFGRAMREVPIDRITSIDIARGGAIALSILDEEPLLLEKMPRSKELAEQLRRTLAK